MDAFLEVFMETVNSVLRSRLELIGDQALIGRIFGSFHGNCKFCVSGPLRAYFGSCSAWTKDFKYVYGLDISMDTVKALSLKSKNNYIEKFFQSGLYDLFKV